MDSTCRLNRFFFFLSGLLLLALGMVLEFVLAALIPSTLLGVLFEQGGLLILLTLLFAGATFLLRRGLLGHWRYRYDYIIFIIAGIIFTAGSLMTILGLQIGHPYLELGSSNPLMMLLLWIFILPPINAVVTFGFSLCLYFAAGIMWVLPPSKEDSVKTSSPQRGRVTVSRWHILLRITRIDVWLGSLFLVTLAYLILGGPPLSPTPLPLYDAGMWIRFLMALLAAGLINSWVFILNQLGDLDTDQLHYEKSQLPISAGQLTRTQSIIVALIALFGGILTAISVGVLYLLVLTVVILFAVVYSLPPIRLKARPFCDFVIIGLAFGSWAVLAAWTILFARSELPLILLIGPGVFYAGTHGIHTAADYSADATAGIRTTAVVLGPKKTARIGIILISVGLLLLYSGVGFYTHIFWYGLLKYKSILLIIFSGLPVFALLQSYHHWQQNQHRSTEGIGRIQVQARWVTYLLFVILCAYLILNAFLFYPVYYPNYNFPWS